MSSAPIVQPANRDLRVDLLRGLSLLSIFVDHIPHNDLANYTLHSYGFSDAAELFVALSGFSAMMAYSRVFERDGLQAGIIKIFARCLKIYGAQLLILLATLLIVSAWARFTPLQTPILGPMLKDGLKGTMRGIGLLALPTYLDILPLYILLLASFPIIRFGLSKSVALTLTASLILWGFANVFHWDLPNFVDPSVAARWYFNPFTWQLVFICGSAFAVWSRTPGNALTKPPITLLAVCWLYLIFAFLATDAWKLWPPPFGDGFPSLTFPFALFGNEPKSFVTPWRLFHVLALIYIALSSPRLIAVARLRVVASVVACGRHSLAVFTLGSLLALVARLIFTTAGVTPATEIFVNSAGLGLMLLFGIMLDRRAAASRDQANGRGLGVTSSFSRGRREKASRRDG